MTPDTSPPGLVSRPLVLLFLATLGAMTSFCLLLSVVPLYASTVGADRAGAGLATGALLLTTVVAELATPWLMARHGPRRVLGAGLLLLGAPSLALPAATDLVPIIAASGVRGLGFGMIVVVGSALVPVLVPPGRRGEGLGLYGVVVGLPTVVALPAGVWLSGQLGFVPVFVAGAVASLVALAAVPAMPAHRRPQARPVADHPVAGHPVAGHPATDRPATHDPAADDPASRHPATPRRDSRPHLPAGVLAGLRTPSLLRPSVAFGATAMASGVVVTFVPLALPHRSELAALALLAQALAATVTRWWAGRYGDRRDPAHLLIPGVTGCALGVLGLIPIGAPVAVLGGMLLFGAGFGICQNASLTLMLGRVPASGFGTVSGIWNVAYDVGMGLGAAGFGVLAAQTGYPAGFALTAGLLVVALLPAWRDLGSRHPAPG